MIKRRASAAGLPASTCCHTFRATGITAYLSNGGTLEHAQQIAGHASPRTTKLYDRTADTVTLDEIETHRDLTGRSERARRGVARPAVTWSSPALGSTWFCTSAAKMPNNEERPAAWWLSPGLTRRENGDERRAGDQSAGLETLRGR